MFMKTQKQIHDHRRFRQPAGSPKIPSAPCVHIMNPACRTPSPPPPYTSPYAAYLYIKLLNQPHPARVAATGPAPATSQRQTQGPENAPGTTAENLPTVHTARPTPRPHRSAAHRKIRRGVRGLHITCGERGSHIRSDRLAARIRAGHRREGQHLLRAVQAEHLRAEQGIV